MKIIDLLNKIANNEEVPDAIKWGCHDFKWLIDEYIAKDEYGEPSLLNYLSRCPNMINDEIITFYKTDEKKIPEKLEDYYLDKKGECPIELTIYEQILRDKINDIIDYLKSKGE